MQTGGACLVLGLALGSLVNAATALLFLATGVAVLALARGRSEVRLLGVTLALWGLDSALGTLFEDTLAGALFGSVIAALLLIAAVVLPWRYPEPATRADWLRLGVLLALVLTWCAWALSTDVRSGRGLVGLVLTPIGPGLPTALALTATAFLGSAFAIRALSSQTHQAQLASLTLVFGLSGAYNAARVIVMLIDIPGYEFSGGEVALLALNLLPVPLWLLASARGGLARTARNTALAIASAAFLGAGLAAVLGAIEVSGYGVPGAVRTVAWGILAIAILRRGLLRRELPRIAVARGPLAAGALATLFIVAQIAQEFFAAEYGLLMGGVVAGTLLFAANPVQRAMERLAGHERGDDGPHGRSPERRPEAGADRETAYRDAVQLALRDRTLSRDEERRLLRLAYHLGVSTPRAMEIHDELEREASGGVA